MTEENFLTTFKQVQHKLFRLAQRMLRNSVDAEDALQSLVEKFWSKRQQLSEAKNQEVFLMVAMKNHCLDVIKKSSRQSTEQLVNTTASTQNLNRQLDAKEQLAQVNFLMDQLPEKQRLILHLRDIEQYEFEEIEAVTGLNQGAIRTNLSRARQTMRAALKKQYQHGLAKN